MKNIKINKYITIGIAAVLLYIVLYFMHLTMSDWNLSF